MGTVQWRKLSPWSKGHRPQKNAKPNVEKDSESEGHDSTSEFREKAQ